MTTTSTADIALVVSSALAIAANILLLILILRNGSPDLRIYKRFMAFSALVDLGLALSNIVSIPRYIAAVFRGESAIVALGIVGSLGYEQKSLVQCLVPIFFRHLIPKT